MVCTLLKKHLKFNGFNEEKYTSKTLKMLNNNFFLSEIAFF